MKILVVGSGGREHTLVWKLAQSKHVQKIYAAPGNGGIGELAECVNIKVDDLAGLADFAKNNKIDLTVVGPELPLVLGIVDEFQRRGLAVFGPSRAASQLEGSKVFAKELMQKYNIPTANAQVFSHSKQAIDYIKQCGAPCVVKAEGLAAGKGVNVCSEVPEAITAIEDIMEKQIFGDAGRRVIVEECLQGEEVSILAFSDGETVIPLVPSQDHKRALDGDKGPNTGGMGAYSPVAVFTPELEQRIQREILVPTIRGMANEGISYRGIIYAGLMLTASGPKVLEYNVRFGDPETQVVLPRMESDLLFPILSTVHGGLNQVQLRWTKRPCVCVVAASGGYPQKYKKDLPIEGLTEASSLADVLVFHAGTRRAEGKCLTSGGRVLGVTALGNTLDDAVKRSYEALDRIKFPQMHYRRDIARRSLKM